MYFVIGAVIGLFGFLVSFYFGEMRDMKTLLRNQQDELSALKKYTQDIHMQLADLTVQSRWGKADDADIAYLKAQLESRKRLEESLPGEVDQEVLL